MDCDELRIEIRRALGVSTRASVPDDPRSGTRRVVNALSSLNEEKLEALLRLVKVTKAIDLKFNDERREGLGNMAGEDTLWLLHAITSDRLNSVFVLAQEGVQIPEGMRVRAALLVTAELLNGYCETSAEQVNAHLYVAHELRTKHSKRYALVQMVITQNHPDKAATIVALASRNLQVRESDVVKYHGVESVLFDGVL